MNTETKLRELKKEDYKEFINVLNSLTKVGDISEKDFCERLNLLKKKEDYIVIVAEKDNKVVGSGTLFIEYKFIHSLALKAHIEDIVVDKEYQGHGIGKQIVKRLIEIAKEKKCYKIGLCTAKETVPFYEKCGFEEKEREMVIYLNK
ncbi:glucosamine 6-phosphate N-acetyltransferase [Tubulinosema ratisbonensis]|uniref:Glucosamine 6-phosphate N-acetyltransferase n=1 Tax=Tubulinosema ratisbonensis TaxID=291195 RepID=A0A437AR26_9MICR|nr:glucosamine 6-phosphate N-acetyltransferase [Tubulinosema ratisbonensis]